MDIDHALSGTAPWVRSSDALAVAVVLDAPPMSDAACKGQYAVFDRTNRNYFGTDREARELCEHCPVLAKCRQWVAALDPWERFDLGFVAGQYWPKPATRRRVAAEPAQKPVPAQLRHAKRSESVPSPIPALTAAQRRSNERKRARHRAKMAARRSARSQGAKTA